MKKLTKTIQLLVLFAVLTAAVFAGAYFLFKTIQDKNKVISEIANGIDAQVAKEEQITSLKVVIKDTEGTRKKVDSFILANDGFVPFVESLEKLGRTVGATTTIEALGTEANGADEKIEFLSVRMRIGGSWSRVYRMLSLLEEMPYALAIDTVTLEQESATAGKSYWQGSVALKVLKNK